MSKEARRQRYAAAIVEVTGSPCLGKVIDAVLRVADSELTEQRSVPAGDHPVPDTVLPVGMQEKAVESIRAATCTSGCDLDEETCRETNIQPFWYNQHLDFVEGRPEMFAAAVLKSLPPGPDRASAVREAVVQVRSLPVTCTALTGPVWYGSGWNDALNEVEDYADRLSGHGEPDAEPISSEELAQRLSESDVWWTKGVVQSWEKLPESLGKSRYRAIAHRMMRELFIARRTKTEENESA